MTEPRPRSDRVLRLGAWVSAAGLVFTVIAILPLLFPGLQMPSAMWFLSMLIGVGLVIVFAGLAMAARERRSR